MARKGGIKTLPLSPAICSPPILHKQLLIPLLCTMLSLLFLLLGEFLSCLSSILSVTCSAVLSSKGIKRHFYPSQQSSAFIIRILFLIKNGHWFRNYFSDTKKGHCICFFLWSLQISQSLSKV